MPKKTMASFPVVRRLLLMLLFLCGASNPCSHAIFLNDTVNIGVILDNNSWLGKVVKTALKLAADDVNNDANLVMNATRLVLHFRHAQTLLHAATAAYDLLDRQVVSIVETQTSEVVSDIGEAAKVPILSFSATTPSLSHQRFPYLVRMAHSDSFHMKAIAALVKHYGWRRVVFVHSDVDFGCGAVSLLTDALRDFGSEVVYISMISSAAEKQSIRKELYKLMEMESRVFVVHLPSDVGLNLFMEAQVMGMMKAGYVWITTPGFTSVWDYVINASTMASMQGVLGIKTHIPNSERLQDFTERWERQFKLDNPNSKNTELSVYGLLAYDAVFMIARAIGKMGIKGSFSVLTPTSPPPPPVANGEINSIKVFQQGKQLLQEILLRSFTGLSGAIELHNGEMDASDSSLFEIVNVVGKSYQIVGYLAYKSGKLFKTLPLMGNEGVAPVFWPGSSTKIPLGWEIPSNGKRLRIVVPRNAGWKEFVNVTFYPDKNETIVTGFCIDVFKAVVRLLNYELPYDLFLYPPHANSTDWSYDDLIRQVYLKKYDAAVGDITIRAWRSEIVEFTQPFTETESVMVAPVIMMEEGNNAWAFLTPLVQHCGLQLVLLLYTQDWWCVGYIKGSFAGDILSQNLGIADKNLKPFSSRETYEEILSKGSKKGGVDAIFDAIPYVRAFLFGRCDYSMVGRRYKSGGFGFVFQKGSPLVLDISKAILNFTQSLEFQEIEAKYFKDNINICSDRGEVPKTLDVRNFRGLFLITGIVSSSVLMVYFYQALRKFVKDSDATGNQWECLKSFARYLYQEPEEVSVSSQVDAAESWEDVEAEELVVDAGENIPSSSQVDAADSLPENEERSWVDVDEGEDMMSPTSTSSMPTTTNEPPSNQIQE
ncbi:hypothetical protein KI387_025324 [Taxus chinensis]|uniref:Glutamate receptor n=1 Tax=Taxus chinensis TaxID=29808 RepID=A0AA38G612_TAXCH|nr:hypothetical protein KI387_025324 [Taxus chinensis]